MQRLPASDLQGAFDGCLFDICVNEGKEEQQEAMRCTAYTKFNNLCLAFAAKHGLRDWQFNWREPTNCRKL